MRFDYDIIVVGAGHAGCEAACAAANLGSRTLLITMDMHKIAQMSCNPAIGGIAKGQIVREIDALGGYTALITDKTAIQFRMLNRSKGAAMWSPRAQSDRQKFSEAWREVIENLPNLFLWQDSVCSLVIEENQIKGVVTALGVTFRSKAVILTTGTFMNGLIHVGSKQIKGGRISEPASYGITEQLSEYGFTVQRMKTGTPVRIDGRSVDFSLATRQVGEEDFHRFSYLDAPTKKLKQQPCWIVYTNTIVHDILRNAIDQSPLYNGQIKSIGPRYCPSIETKIITFADKTEHQLFLEPEGETTQEFYLNGFSSSLPLSVQIDALQQIPAFKNIHIYRPGYAIEYDFFDPTQLYHTLETKSINGLYFAGQINGTTGYEEAAGQGLLAGINAHQKLMQQPPFTLGRDESYIGVLIDDLVTKGVDEPYRMFTSRAEYRILLRQDDADVRLTPRSYAIGLASKERYNRLQHKLELRDALITFVREYKVKPGVIDDYLVSRGTSPLKQGAPLIELIGRPQLTLIGLSEVVLPLQDQLSSINYLREEVIEAAEIAIKYAGYIERERVIADKINRLENLSIKDKFNYLTIASLSTEAKQKLSKINPDTIAQASRIPGISPSDINILLVLMGR